ncbi:hypothetical protein Taro_029259, partial [Colocasia esculenta]|nr:hypothetical protein [Colocasia esculenta]
MVSRFCVSHARECARGLSRCSGTVEVLSSSWTPSLSGRVVVRLRERRQWDSDLVYRWCRMRRCCDRFVPPAVVLVELCELMLPRGMPQ